MVKLAGGALWVAFFLVASYGQAAAQMDVQTVLASGIVINEILAHTDPPQQDAIELYNPTDAAIDIGAWILADDNNAKQRYVIPPATVLAPGAYYVVTLDGDAPFRLSEFGETIFLFQPGVGDTPGPLVDRASFGVSPNGVSFGRITLSTGDTQYALLQAISLGYANALPQVGPLVIDEVIYRPADGRDEYVAIRNMGTAPMTLCDLTATGLPVVLRMDGDDAYVFSCDVVLGPGQRLFVADATPAEFRTQYGLGAGMLVLGPFKGRLSNEGELVEIVWPQPPETDGTIAYYALDQIDYSAAAPWPVITSDGLALRRLDLTGYGNDPAHWRAGASSLLEQGVWLPWVAK